MLPVRGTERRAGSACRGEPQEVSAYYSLSCICALIYMQDAVTRDDARF